MIVGVIVNVGLLGYFKYYNFFIENLNVIFSGVNFRIQTLKIALPVGVSFYTFRNLSYIIDIYRRVFEPCSNILEFTIYVMFFPQLLAGPIVRPTEFIPQLRRGIVIKRHNIIVGLQIFIYGLVKKVLIADRLAYFVDNVFENPNIFNTTTIWLAVIAYSLQIYCDFSGYSDMAIGLAKTMGFDTPKNFDRPYISKSITEFWRRWHITLGSWFRDYVYIPLGGNRKGTFILYRNLLIVWILTGLWHGSNWNYMFWGLWHGAGLCVEKAFYKKVQTSKNFFINFVSFVITYIFVCIGWAFFKIQNLTDIIIVLEKMFAFNNKGVAWIYSSLWLIIPIFILSNLYLLKNNLNEYPLLDLKSFKGAFIFIFIIMAIVILSPTTPTPFIYFQF